MNKKGAVFLGVVLCLFLWATGVLLIPYVTDVIDWQRGELSCSSNDLAGYVRLMCLLTDSFIPYFIYFLLLTSVGLIVGGMR